MKLFVTFIQELKADGRTLDKSTWKSDLDTEAKTVTTLLKDLKTRSEVDENVYTISDEAVLSEGNATKNTDKVENLNKRALVYKYTITKK